MKKRMKKRIIDYQINKEETTGWEYVVNYHAIIVN